MKKTTNHRRVINQYSAWKYVVIVTALVVLALSAIPTWFGELPAVQINHSQNHTHSQTLSAVELDKMLREHEVEAVEITVDENQTTLLFNDEHAQTRARSLLNDTLQEGDTITFSYLSVAPRWLDAMGFSPIKLGLDLRGGVQFLLHVDIEHAFQEQREAMVDELRAWVRELNYRGAHIRLDADYGISINGVEELNLRNFLSRNYPDWQLNRSRGNLVIVPNEQSLIEFQTTTLMQNLAIMRGRIEELGITEALVQRQGREQIRIELPGVQDPAQAKAVIGATASLAFYEVLDPTTATRHNSNVLQDEHGHDVVLARRPVMTGKHIVNASAGIDQMGMSEVNINLDRTGGRMMSDFSAKHINQPMATVYREYSVNQLGQSELSERVISVATIQSRLGSQFRITGAGSMSDAQELAMLLRAGSLTAPVSIVEERTIGASLGAENIQNGFAALALGMGLTLVFMACWYRRLGWVANLALCANIVCLLGLIALIPGAILTLPGIAGLVLTVGMAVDTNVLIFERIKDKMREGRSFAQAIDKGFASTFSTILDANLTSMITAVVLYTIGNGPIQGFALTLGLGLLTSMFTGVFASRAIINLTWGRDTRCHVKV